MDEMIARQEGSQIMGPRVPIGRRIVPVDGPAVRRDWEIFSTRLFSRATDSSECSNTNHSNTCEKPTNMSLAGTITVAIM